MDELLDAIDRDPDRVYVNLQHFIQLLPVLKSSDPEWLDECLNRSATGTNFWFSQTYSLLSQKCEPGEFVGYTFAKQEIKEVNVGWWFWPKYEIRNCIEYDDHTISDHFDPRKSMVASHHPLKTLLAVSGIPKKAAVQLSKRDYLKILDIWSENCKEYKCPLKWESA